MKKLLAATVIAGCGAEPAPSAREGGPTWTVLRGDYPEVEVAPFDAAVLSWNGDGVDGRFELRVRSAGTWSSWFTMGRAAGGKLSSVKQPGVDVDTLLLPAPADGFQVRAEGAAIRSLAVTHWLRRAERSPDGARSAAWGRTLDVPLRSQTSERAEIAGRICSPTSLAMALEFLGVKRSTEEIAELVYDHDAGIYGNWSFNAAVAGRLIGESFVVRADGFALLESEVVAGRPVVLSHKWKKGELTGAPVESSDGHLVVVVGFSETGDVVVNDPAAKPGTVRRTYRRAEIWRTWQQNASGIVYLLRPRK